MNQAQEASIKAHRIVVLSGGPSAERTISLQSGRAVVRALEERGRRVIEIDPAVTDLKTFDWSPVDLVFPVLREFKMELIKEIFLFPSKLVFYD